MTVSAAKQPGVSEVARKGAEKSYGVCCGVLWCLMVSVVVSYGVLWCLMVSVVVSYALLLSSSVHLANLAQTKKL